jgi:hypothetical protein
VSDVEPVTVPSDLDGLVKDCDHAECIKPTMVDNTVKAVSTASWLSQIFTTAKQSNMPSVLVSEPPQASELVSVSPNNERSPYSAYLDTAHFLGRKSRALSPPAGSPVRHRCTCVFMG